MDRVFSPMAGKFIGSLSEVYLCAGAMFFRFVLFAWLCQWNVCENSSSKGWPAVYLCTGAVFFHSASFVYGLSTTCHAKRCFFSPFRVTIVEQRHGTCTLLTRIASLAVVLVTLKHSMNCLSVQFNVCTSVFARCSGSSYFMFECGRWLVGERCKTAINLDFQLAVFSWWHFAGCKFRFKFQFQKQTDMLADVSPFCLYIRCGMGARSFSDLNVAGFWFPAFIFQLMTVSVWKLLRVNLRNCSCDLSVVAAWQFFNFILRNRCANM